MPDEISDVVNDLNALNTATLRSAVEFSGFTKSITQAAAGTEGASKAWTTFSRLVSGSPIWAIQNKIRAYLAILAGFENRSQANTKAMKEEEQKFVKKVLAMGKVNEQYKFMNENIKEAIEQTKLQGIAFEEAYGPKVKASMKEIAKYEASIEKLQNRNLPPSKIAQKQREFDIKALEKKMEAEQKNLDTMQKLHDSTTEAIKNTKEYALAIAAGASEQMAMAQGSLQLGERMKDLRADEKKLTRAAKDAYAFDEKRIETAKKMAAVQAKAMGFDEKKTKRVVKLAGKMQKKKMGKEQKIIKSKQISENMQGLPSMKDLKPLLILGAPIKGIFKVAKDRKKLQLKMIKFTNKLKGGLDIAFRYFLFGVLAIIAFMTLIPVFFAIKDAIKPFMGDIKHFGGRLLDFGKDIFDVIKTFMDGDFDTAVKMIGPLVDTGIGLLIDFGMGLFTIGQTLLFALIDMGIEFVHKFFTDPEFREPIIERLLQIGKIILAAWFVKTILANAIQLIGIYALPILIWGLGAIVLYRIVQHLIDKGQELWDGAKTFFTNFFTFIGEYFTEFLPKFFDDVLDALGNAVKSTLTFGLLHTGGVSSGGPTMVGEKGPELLNLPKGSRVYNHQQTPSLTKGGGNTVNNYITINAKDTSDQELRRIADRIGSMVNNKINRTTSSRTFG
tara:strand:+ start:513 stop:2525 length:2013 start_codon:yes stop_codon:yes gene_type:complete